MKQISAAAVEQAMKLQDMLLLAMAKPEGLQNFRTASATGPNSLR